MTKEISLHTAEVKVGDDQTTHEVSGDTGYVRGTVKGKYIVFPELSKTLQQVGHDEHARATHLAVGENGIIEDVSELSPSILPQADKPVVLLATDWNVEPTVEGE